MTRRLEFDDITLIICKINRIDGDTRATAERRAIDILISKAFGKDTHLLHHPSGAPFLDKPSVNISISHSRDYACIAYSATRNIGVDIEQSRAQLRQVAPRVMSHLECEAYHSDDLLLKAWTMKEALYKAALTPGLDFCCDILLPLPPESSTAFVCGIPYTIITSISTADYTLTITAPKV